MSMTWSSEFWELGSFQDKKQIWLHICIYIYVLNLENYNTLWASHRIKEDVGMERKNEKQIIALKDLWHGFVTNIHDKDFITLLIHCKWLTCHLQPSNKPAPLWTCTKTSPYWASSHEPRSPTQSMPRISGNVMVGSLHKTWRCFINCQGLIPACFKKTLLCLKWLITLVLKQTNLLLSLRPPPHATFISSNFPPHFFREPLANHRFASRNCMDPPIKAVETWQKLKT